MRKRMLSLFLALIMICSLAACGGNGTTDKGNETNNAASKEGVFKVTDMGLLEQVFGEAENTYCREIKMIGDTVYMLAEAYLSDGSRLVYLTTDMDGNIKTQATIYEEIWEKYDVDDDFAVGEASSVESAVVTDVAVNEGSEDEISEYRNSYSYLIMDDGKLAYVDSTERYNYTTGISTTECKVVLCAENGEEIASVNLSETLEEDMYLYINTLLDSGEGTLYAMSDEKIFEVSVAGELVGTYETTEVTQSIYRAEFYKDGKPVFASWNDDWTKRTYNMIDIKNGTIIEEVVVMDTITNYNICDGTNSGYDLVLTDNSAVYGYNFDDTEPTKIMDYINSNLATYSVYDICFRDSDYFIAMYNDIVNYNSRLAGFTKVPPEEVPDRILLTLAIYGTDTEITRAVIDFNQSNEKYKILTEDYSRYSTEDDWYAGIDRLDSDVLSGKIPDIIQGNTRLDTSKYASKGLFVDFYKLMDEDESINRSDYAENVFKAYETDGKLYEIPIKFYVSTVYGKTSVWGNKTSITWEDVEAVLAQYPDAKLFAEMTKDTALRESLRYSYNQLVDGVTGVCHFDSDAFKSLLEYANTYPESINYDELYNDDNYWLNYSTQYAENRTLLVSSTIYSLYDAWMNGMNNFAEEVTPVGFPTDAGQGSGVMALNSFLISAKSKYTEGAWEFVKSFLSEDYQLEEEDSTYSAWGLPVLKAGIEEQKKYICMKPFYYDSEGKKVEYENSIYIGNEYMTIDPGTEEEAQKWYDFVLSVDTKTSTSFDKALEIITEEAAAYFSGQKTVDEVAGIIQSRMSIFISESQ